jgi:hypothetical protein
MNRKRWLIVLVAALVIGMGLQGFGLSKNAAEEPDNKETASTAGKAEGLRLIKIKVIPTQTGPC